MITTANENAIASMKDQGVEIIELSAEERAKLVEGGQKYLGEWADTAKASGLPADTMLEDYAALIAKYTQERDTNGYPWAKSSN
jgi:TRAP-type C4-dicarboxylate transport system substrate-binding protein